VNRTVVVGFVNSPEGAASLAAAAEEALRRNASIVLVSSTRGGRDDGETVISVREGIERAEAELLARGLAVEVREFARGNDPAADLLEVAAERQAELIVIGLRRRSPVGKLLLGSNAQSILLSADCDVLAVKAPATP
jgi:nucleotide-binding universal stress UspA family protein